MEVRVFDADGCLLIYVLHLLGLMESVDTDNGVRVSGVVIYIRSVHGNKDVHGNYCRSLSIDYVVMRIF